ncbi:MAG: hypothetical protein HUU22_03715 [Phycisphaerae bacterium]|nr:hypothetical protein [Phycisphaerae bacterium]
MQCKPVVDRILAVILITTVIVVAFCAQPVITHARDLLPDKTCDFTTIHGGCFPGSYSCTAAGYQCPLGFANWKKGVNVQFWLCITLSGGECELKDVACQRDYYYESAGCLDLLCAYTRYTTGCE